MSAVNESIVREYFEQLGFLVSQPCKYITTGRTRRAEEEFDLLVAHPRIAENRLPDRIIWTSSDFKTVGRAVVGVRGWHTERFYAATFEQTPEMLRFAEPVVRGAAAVRLGTESVAAILCLPELPASGELKEKTLTALKQRGIDGVISFKEMLTELLAIVKINRNYEKSDLLQILRILKNYRLLKDPQLELFARKGRRIAVRDDA
jgi:hypothetical protein